jgi:hypothetical protein
MFMKTIIIKAFVISYFNCMREVEMDPTAFKLTTMTSK